MSYEIIHDKISWNEKLKEFSEMQRDIYFSYEYISLDIIDNPGIPECFYFENSNGKAFYPYIKRIISKEYVGKNYYDISSPYGYGGPLLEFKNKVFLKEFHGSFIKYCKKNDIIAEFIRFHPLLKNHISLKSTRNIIKNRFTVAVDLKTTYSNIYNNYSKQNKRAIKKGSKYLTFEFVDKISEVNINFFIKLYYQTMERLKVNKFYFFSVEYFRDLFKKLADNILLAFVKFENKIISAGIFFYNKNYIHYHLGCSDEKYLIYRPNNFLFDNIIKYGVENNIKYLFLGGGNTQNEDDSLLRFKKNFSKDIYQFYIGTNVINSIIYENIKSKLGLENKEINKILFYRES